MDLVDFLPDELKRELLDQVVDFVSRQAEKVGGEQLAGKIRMLSSEAAFLGAFDQAMKAGTARFLAEYTTVDEDLVAAIAADADFWQSPQVRQALIQLVKRPGAWLVDEREAVIHHFEDVLPRRVNRERVDRAVVAYLRCIAEELWTLPGAKEVREVYQIRLEQYSADALRQQVELQKAQLRALDGLNAGVREALLQLTDALAKQALQSGERTPQLATPERPRVRHNLPQPDYGKFVGRDKELADILRVLRPYPHSQIHVVTIDGIGGIGKSTLALEVAHRYLNNFDRLPPAERFEAIVWMSAKQNILTADGIVQRRQVLRTLDDIYRAVAVTLQQEEIVRARPEEQPEMVRNALTQQRTLLIVDNLETVDDEAVIALLRELPAPTKAIITTRHRIDVAYPVRLTGMPWEDARKLITHESGKKNVALGEAEERRLYDRTGGVPLALVWSIAQMSSGHSVESILRRLGNATSDIARFCFEGTVESIRHQPAHTLLMALSLFATDANREILGCVTDLPPLDRDEGLALLEKLSLINKNGERFQALPLTQVYSRAELAHDSNVEHDLRERWLDCLAGMLKKSSQGQRPELEAVRSEIPNVLAAIEYCVQVSNWEMFRILVIEADNHLWYFGYVNALANYDKIMIDVAIHEEQPRLQSEFLRRLANIHDLHDEPEEACRLAETAVALDRLYGYDRELIRSLYNLSAAQWKAARYDLARSSAAEAIEVAQKTGAFRHAVRNQCQLARIEISEGKIESAQTMLQSALRMTDEFSDQRGDVAILTMLYRLLGVVAFSQGDYQAANQYYQRSLEAAQSGGLTTMEIRVKVCMTQLAVATRNFEYARTLGQETLKLCTTFGMNREKVEVQGMLDHLEPATN
jgi:tetratricopeptide (TPR) repeat protein